MTDLSIWDSDYVINASSLSDQWDETTILSTMIEAADWAIVHNELTPIHQYKDNPLYWRGRQKQYRSNPVNQEKIRVRSQNRRTRVLSLPSTLTSKQWKYALDYFEYKCAVCGKASDFWTVLAQDHWVAIINGGGTTADNIIPLCHPKHDAPVGELYCNSSKKGSSPDEWLLKRFGKRKAAEVLKRVNEYFGKVRAIQRSNQ